MLTLFMADPDAVRVTISDVGRHGCGPYRLLIEHAEGELVEYFPDVTKALLREGEIEDLVITARWMTSAEWTGGSLRYASRSKRCTGLTASVFCAPEAR
jgi:hypothetical protein